MKVTYREIKYMALKLYYALTHTHADFKTSHEIEEKRNLIMKVI